MAGLNSIYVFLKTKFQHINLYPSPMCPGAPGSMHTACTLPGLRAGCGQGQGTWQHGATQLAFPRPAAALELAVHGAGVLQESTCRDAAGSRR